MDKVEKVFLFLMSVMDRIIGVLISLAVLAVLWGILTYFFKYSPEKRKEANAFILYGLLSLFVIVSLWGFVNLFGSTIGIKTNPPMGNPNYEISDNFSDDRYIDILRDTDQNFEVETSSNFEDDIYYNILNEQDSVEDNSETEEVDGFTDQDYIDLLN